MKFPRKIMTTMLAVGAAIALPLGSAEAATPNPTSPAAVQSALTQALQAVPGGVRISDNSVAWDNGAVVLTVPTAAHPDTQSDCDSGWFCFWAGTGYSGRILRFEDTGYLQDLTPYNMDIDSYWNNRYDRAFIHSAYPSGGIETCVSPHGVNSNTSGSWVHTAKGIYLATTASC